MPDVPKIRTPARHRFLGFFRRFGGPVTRITIHHEGGNVPRDVDLSGSGYSASVFPAGSRIWRSPFVSWATYGYNHVSFDIVLTGDRMTAIVTGDDITRIANLLRQAVANGWVSPAAEVHPHGTLYPVPIGPSGSSPTQCPGLQTVADATWRALYGAVHAALNPTPPPPPAPKVRPMYDPPIAADLGFAAVWKIPVDVHGELREVVLAAVAPNGDVYAWGVPYRKWPNQHVDFAGRTAARIGQAEGLPFGRYTITATSGETYTP